MIRTRLLWGLGCLKGMIRLCLQFLVSGVEAFLSGMRNLKSLSSWFGLKVLFGPMGVASRPGSGFLAIASAKPIGCWRFAVGYC